ncbi:MAG: F0F1 ATP synthase subunit delta [Pseudomonadota bacterium]
MIFNWWTFLLQLVNFLILLYILRRLLYGPILEVLGRRRERIESELAAIDARRAEVEEQGRRQREALRGFDVERARILAEARAEAVRERLKLLAQAREEARREREEQRAALEGERVRVMREVQEDVVRAALEISRRLLFEVSGQRLHDALVDLILSEIKGLSRQEAVRRLASVPERRVSVVGARPLSEGQRRVFEEVLHVWGEDIRLEVEEDFGLEAGARVEVGELVLDATVATWLERLRREVFDSLDRSGEAGR